MGGLCGDGNGPPPLTASQFARRRAVRDYARRLAAAWPPSSSGGGSSCSRGDTTSPSSFSYSSYGCYGSSGTAEGTTSSSCRAAGSTPSVNSRTVVRTVESPSQIDFHACLMLPPPARPVLERGRGTTATTTTTTATSQSERSSC